MIKRNERENYNIEYSAAVCLLRYKPHFETQSWFKEIISKLQGDGHASDSKVISFVVATVCHLAHKCNSFCQHSSDACFLYHMVEQSYNRNLNIHIVLIVNKCNGRQMSRDMRFPTFWYVRPAKAVTSLRIHTD